MSRAYKTASGRLAVAAGGDLAFVGGEGGQDFGLLPLRHFEEVERPSEFRSNLIEFCWGNPEVPVGLLEAKLRRSGLGGGVLEGAARNVADTASA